VGRRRLFGTDGIRGLANGELLTPELAVAVAASAARVLAERMGSHRPVAVVGRDPRASGEMLEAAVVAGLASAGADALRVGILPTPAVAHLVDALGADLGVMISASHNAMPDNGIKLFAAGGQKLPDAVEDAVAAGLDVAGPRPTGAGIGRVRDLPDAGERYVAHLLTAVPAGSLAGLRVVVDCAHGAASAVAPEAYRRAGPRASRVAAEPTGSTSTTGWGPRTSTAAGGRAARTAPTWAWPTTATPTAASRRRRGDGVTATASSPCSPWPCTMQGSSPTTRSSRR
jgi:phosphoglucosamine mutase